MSLTSSVLGVIQTKANAGLKTDIQRLVPTRTGALKRSVVIEVRQQHAGSPYGFGCSGISGFKKPREWTES